MKVKAKRLLTDLDELAGYLRIIAQNGKEWPQRHLVSFANEMHQWATSVLKACDQAPKVIVIVEGGIVQDVFTDASSAYTVVDHDSEDTKGPSVGSYATHPLSKLDTEIQKLV